MHQSADLEEWGGGGGGTGLATPLKIQKLKKVIKQNEKQKK